MRQKKSDKEISDLQIPTIKISDLDLVEKESEICSIWIKEQTLVVGYPVIVASCFHNPYVSVKWLKILHNKALDLAKTMAKLRFPNLIISGDFYDLYSASPSNFVNVGPSTELKQEFEIGRLVLNNLLEDFERIYIFLGNHDMKLLKVLGKQGEAFIGKDYAKILFGKSLDNELIDTRVFISNLKWCESSDGKWLYCHYDPYSKKGNIPVEVAEIKDKNVCGSHSHLLSMRKTKNGKFWGIDGGGMFNEKSLLYKNTRITTHPEFNNGFVFINEKGEPRLYGDGLPLD